MSPADNWNFWWLFSPCYLNYCSISRLVFRRLLYLWDGSEEAALGSQTWVCFAGEGELTTASHKVAVTLLLKGWARNGHTVSGSSVVNEQDDHAGKVHPLCPLHSLSSSFQGNFSQGTWVFLLACLFVFPPQRLPVLLLIHKFLLGNTMFPLHNRIKAKVTISGKLAAFGTFRGARGKQTSFRVTPSSATACRVLDQDIPGQ